MRGQDAEIRREERVFGRRRAGGEGRAAKVPFGHILDRTYCLLDSQESLLPPIAVGLTARHRAAGTLHTISRIDGEINGGNVYVDPPPSQVLGHAALGETVLGDSFWTVYENAVEEPEPESEPEVGIEGEELEIWQSAVVQLVRRKLSRGAMNDAGAWHDTAHRCHPRG